MIHAASASHFKKDARRAFWLDDSGASRSFAWVMVQFLLPLAWWILIVRLIHAQTLPGDRQFWITRPYEWKSLLGAKLIFIAAFVNLPLLAADLIILGAYGFAPWAEIHSLLWRQVLCSVVFLLPVAVVCAVTSGLVQLLSAGFVARLRCRCGVLSEGEGCAGETSRDFRFHCLR